MVAAWLADPLLMAQVSASGVLAGWTASFTNDADVGAVSRALSWAIGRARARRARALRLRRNRPDAWYVAISLAIVFAWVFREENTRRLLYPLLPLMLFHAGEALAALALTLRTRHVAIALGTGAALVAATSFRRWPPWRAKPSTATR
jgi:hypothetical protein